MQPDDERSAGRGSTDGLRWEGDAPAVAEEVARLRRAVSLVAEQAGATEARRADLALAVSEALSNVVNHAYTDRETPGPMRVALELDGETLLLEVSDEGAGVRPRLASAGAGLGLAVMSALATELTLSPGDGGTGTRVVMRFALDGRR